MLMNGVFQRNAIAFGLMRCSSLGVGSSTPGIGQPKITPPHTVANSEILINFTVIGVWRGSVKNGAFLLSPS